MNPTHIHLLITHLPIIGSILGAFVLAHAIWSRSNPTKIAAYNLFIICAIGAGIAYLTGEPAEESVEHLTGVSEEVIERHEHFAVYALGAMIALGVFSIAGILITLKAAGYARTVAFVIFFVSLISFGLIARTGYLGGQIRHTEIHGTPAPAANTESGYDED